MAAKRFPRPLMVIVLSDRLSFGGLCESWSGGASDR